MEARPLEERQRGETVAGFCAGRGSEVVVSFVWLFRNRVDCFPSRLSVGSTVGVAVGSAVGCPFGGDTGLPALQQLLLRDKEFESFDAIGFATFCCVSLRHERSLDRGEKGM
jgi:hypothetical protein